jgi:hypothetical protein
VAVQRMAVALRALAERWSRIEPGERSAMSPFAGAEDLNDERAIESAGILFMEGEGVGRRRAPTTGSRRSSSG